MVNARVGLRGPDERWAVELWAQNLFDKDYTQVAFNSPFQEARTSAAAASPIRSFPGGRADLLGAFLAEPRTYGLTLRGRFSRPAPRAERYVAPPAPPRRRRRRRPAPTAASSWRPTSARLLAAAAAGRRRPSAAKPAT